MDPNHQERLGSPKDDLVVSNDKEALICQEPLGFATANLIEQIASLSIFRKIAMFDAKGELIVAQMQTQILNRNRRARHKGLKARFQHGVEQKYKVVWRSRKFTVARNETEHQSKSQSSANETKCETKSQSSINKTKHHAKSQPSINETK